MLVGCQEIVRPGDRRPDRLLTRIEIAAAAQEVQASAEPFEDLRRLEDRGTRSGELNRQGQVVQPGAEVGDRFAPLDAGPGTEQGYGIVGGERGYGVLNLASDPKQLPAGHEQRQVRACGYEPRQVGSRGDDLFEVVQDEQDVALSDVIGNGLVGAHRPGDRLDDVRRMAEGRKVDPVDAGGAGRNERSCGLDCEPGLARAAGSGQGDDPRRSPEEVDGLLELAFAADERAGGSWEVGRRDRSEWWKSRFPELEDQYGVGDVLQPMLTEGDERRQFAEKVPGRAGEDDLAAVGCRGDARGEVEGLADVALIVQPRLARVDPDADTAGRRPVRRQRRLPAMTAPEALANATRKASPWVSTSMPSFARHTARMTLRCWASRPRSHQHRVSGGAGSNLRCR